MKSSPRIKYVARWPGPIEGHAVNTVKHYYGILHPWHEFDDLLQEAYIVFMRCKRAYAETVDNPAWFMSLFSNSLRNRFINLIRHGPRYNFIEDTEMALADSRHMFNEEGYLQCLLQEVPPVLNMMVRLATQDKISPQRRKSTRRHLEDWLHNETGAALSSLIKSRPKSA